MAAELRQKGNIKSGGISTEFGRPEKGKKIDTRADQICLVYSYVLIDKLVER